MARKSRPRAARGLAAAGPGFRWRILAGAVLGALLALVVLRPGGLPALAVESDSFAGAPVLVAAVAAAFALFGACTVWLCITDVRKRRLPNSVLLLATVGLTVPLSVASLVWGSPASLGLTWAGAGAFTLLILLVWLVAPHSIGGGDVKLALAAGFLPAWVMPVTSFPLLLLFLLGMLVIVGSVAIARHRRSIPLGPVMLAASWAVALIGPEILPLIGG